MTLLEIIPDKITYTSDYFDQLYQYAIKIIEKGLAYVDDTDVSTVSNVNIICKKLKIIKHDI